MQGKRDKKPRRNQSKHDQQLSRALSSILRHKAIEEGLSIDSSGFVDLDELMKFLVVKKGFKNLNFKQIQQVVQNNDKKRFQLKQQGKHIYIRATQGHTIKTVKTQDLLTPIEDPTQFPVVIHGTYMKFWNLIKNEGLKRMSRNHIHCAPGLPKEEGVISGMRGSCDIYIEIDLFGSMKDGMKWGISTNNVILTEGDDGVINPKYFKRVIKKDGTVIQQNGKQV